MRRCSLDADGRRVRGRSTGAAGAARRGGVIGYYVHHVGAGTCTGRRPSRAAPAASRSPASRSLPRPDGWPGPGCSWPATTTPAPAVDADGRAASCTGRPLGDPGLRSRMARPSRVDGRPPRRELVVVDVSVEVALLARLHGVPVVVGGAARRRDDPPHLLGFGVADALVAAWPRGRRPACCRGAARGAAPTACTPVGGAVPLPGRASPGAAPPDRRRGARAAPGTGGARPHRRRRCARRRRRRPSWDVDGARPRPRHVGRRPVRRCSPTRTSW